MATRKTTRTARATRKVAARPAAKVPERFANLSAPQRRQVMRRIGRHLALAISHGGYKVVSGPDQRNRNYIIAENGGEEKQLSQSERNRIIAFARSLKRNSDQMESILHQYEVQVVGPVGGKAVFDFGGDELEDPREDSMTDAFAEWARQCEFFEDENLNAVLKKVLRTQILGGDLVLVFDDDLVTDSGQIITFEPDCIGNLEERDFAAVFGSDYTQQQGIIKDANSKTVGVIVSWSQRGQSTYRLTVRDDNDNERMGAWPLVRQSATWRDSLFILHRSTWRFNQGHGSSGLWSALATMCDLTDLQGYEIQAAKKNSQTIGQVINTEPDQQTTIDPDYNPDATAPIVTDETDGGSSSEPQPTEEDEGVDADFEMLDAAGCVYDLMPRGVKMELLDTKHPNASMPQFITWLQRVAAYTIGLSAFHATGKADSSYSAAMAEIQLSQKSFDDEWHKLECSILDWVMERWYRWARRNGTFPLAESELPPHWQRRCVTWERPRQKALNPVDEQRAYSEGLRNGSITYRDIYGANWKREIAQRMKEKAQHLAQNMRYFPETDNNGMTGDDNPPPPEPTNEDNDE